MTDDEINSLENIKNIPSKLYDIQFYINEVDDCLNHIRYFNTRICEYIKEIYKGIDITTQKIDFTNVPDTNAYIECTAMRLGCQKLEHYIDDLKAHIDFCIPLLEYNHKRGDLNESTKSSD